MPDFIPPQTEIDKNHPQLSEFATRKPEDLVARWDTEEGQSILDAWRKSGFSREKLSELAGKFYGHFDLRGIPLPGEKLRKLDLSNIDFFRANLNNADLTASNLDNSYLSEANLKCAQFDWCRMNGVLVDNAQFDNKTSLIGVDLNSINFTLAVLLQEQAHGQQRIEHLKRRHPKFAWWLRVTCDYGNSLPRFSLWVSCVLLGFSVTYYWIPQVIANSTGQSPTFLDSLYFSIVTFTTLGYGDWTPISIIGKILVMLEVITGYLMGGLMVAILAKRVMGN